MDVGISCNTISGIPVIAYHLHEKEIPGTRFQLAPGIQYIDLDYLSRNVIQQNFQSCYGLVFSHSPSG